MSGAQVVDLLCKGGVVLCNSPCVMCDEGKPDAVVPDVDVRMVTDDLGDPGNVIDEGHGEDEVLKGPLLDEFVVFEGPVGEAGQGLLDLLICQLLHGFSFAASSG